jgi:type II secretory pathway predicted ATPase ExeA
LNFASSGHPDLSILFVGEPEALLEIPASLTDRMTARCLLGPFTEEESATYLSGRLASAGRKDPLFSKQAVSILHRAANGIPRRINHLADLALLIAYAQDLTIVDEPIIEIAARDFHSEAA